jgi:hypothetical protein
MKVRWPLHPLPLREESLSSWLHRLAHAYGEELPTWYQTTFQELFPSDKQLDVCPSTSILEQLSAGTGLSLHYLWGLTLNGYVPWMIDNLSNENSEDVASCYFTQHCRLLPWKSCSHAACPCANKRGNITPWLSTKKTPLVCTKCLESDPIPYLRLYWRLTLMASCPFHRIRLTEQRYDWQRKMITKNKQSEGARTVSKEVQHVDQLSLQAITTGQVLLTPALRIDAGAYCRWLRWVISELFCQAVGREAVNEIWYAAGVAVRLGLFEDSVFEELKIDERYAVLQVVGYMIKALPSGLDSYTFPFETKNDLTLMPRREIIN